MRQLEDEEGPAGRLLEAVDRGDARVVEGGEELRFTLEAGEPHGVAGEVRGQQLERDLAVEPGVARSENLAHPPRTEGGQDLVPAEAAPRAKAQD